MVFQESQKAETSLSLKKYTLPFLTSQITTLSLFSPEFQRIALDIQVRLARLNEEIDVAWFHYTKTFDSSLSDLNRKIVRANLMNLYRNMVMMCRDIVDKIDIILTRRK